ncbi:MAG: glutamate--tRNA ligase family protein, partial [Planctomycetota bacterium]|nr:glutamate--tRNA ligase family protein [Planctomycetota bacterium]
QCVVRLKMPREGSVTVQDLVRGEVTFDWAREQDHVVQRADGTCLYHLASVVDDYDFQISHVIRAEEHLSNTPRQIFIAQSLDYPLPVYAHLPFVAEPGSKNKLSKRKLDKYLKNADFARVNEHGLAIAKAIGLTTSADTFNPVIVDFYEQVGYLPEAILNYLLLIGWSYDDKREYFSRDEMIAEFSLERVTKGAASFDPKKLSAFQDHYMQLVPLKQKVASMLPYLQKAGLVTVPPPCSISDRLTAIIEAAGDRIKVRGDILDYRTFFVPAEQVQYDSAALDKRITKPAEAAGLLTKFQDTLRTVEPFDAPALETALKQFVAEQGIQNSQIIHALRVAVTGTTVGFGLFESLAILGRDECLARIDRALKLATTVPVT